MKNITEEKNNGLYTRLFNGVMWNMIGLILSKGITLFISIIIARALRPEIFGQYGMINSTVSMFAVFAGMGLGVTTTRYVAKYRKEDPTQIGAIIGLTNGVAIITGIVMATILFVLSEWLAKNYLNAPNLGSALRIISPALIFNTFSGVQTGSLSGFEEFRSIARVSIINSFISVPIILIGMLINGLNGLLWANVIVAIILVVMNTRELSKIFKKYKIKLEFNGVLKQKKILWTTAVPAMLSNAMVGPVTWFANTIILSQNNGFSEIGLFNAAYQWRILLTFIPSTVTSVFLPILITEPNNKKMEKINILFSWIVVIVCALPIITFPEIISMFYGGQYSGQVFNIMLILSVLIACIMAYKEGISRKLITNNLIWFSFASNMVWGGLLIVFTYVFKNQGGIGLSIAYTLAYILNTVIFIPYYLKKRIISRELIISKRILVIWAVIVVQIIVGVANLASTYKFIILCINILLLVLMIAKLIGGKSYNVYRRKSKKR